MVFETTNNHVNKCQSVGWPYGLAGNLLKKLRKWTKPSDLTVMLELRAQLCMMRMKTKGYDGDVMLTNMDKKFKGTYCVQKRHAK